MRPMSFAFELLMRAVARLAPLLRSRTGRANPRVRHLTPLGYALRAYRLLYPNTRVGARGDAPLFPAVVQVQTVNRCNAACPMCPYPYTVGREPYRLMPDALWEKIASECAAEPGCRALVPMSMNEPLLDPRLEARLAFFRQRARPHQETELVTNGALLDAARLRRLADSGLDLLTVSVSAATPETYRATMGGLKWERLRRNLRSLDEADTGRVNVFVRFIRQRANDGEERAFRREWRRAGFNVLAYEVNNRSGTVRGYGDLAVPRSIRTRARRALRRLLGARIFPVCPHAFSIAHIRANGDLPLCSNDWQHREVLGNVRRQSIREAFNSPRAREIRGLMRRGSYDEIAPCRDCSLWKEAQWL